MSFISGKISEGLMHHREGRLDLAEAAYRAALETQPNLPEALHLLGVLVCQRGELEAGLALLEQAVRADPNRAETHFNLGKAASGLGDLEQAEAAFRRALELKPDYADALNNLGNLLHIKSDLEAARDCFKQAMSAEPNYPEAALNLSLVYRDLGLLDEAETLLRRLAQSQPENFDVLFAFGSLLRDQLKLSEALAVFERALKVNPKDAGTGHLISVLRGENPMLPPLAYTLNLFDNYAARFDHQLVHRLHYDAPEQLAALVRTLRSGAARFQNALDLGCGTGLSGLAFRALSERLTGVDLSPNMLARARLKGVYDRVALEEAVIFLEAMGDAYDLFIATDVFIYMGNLEPLFAAVRQRCRPGGWFVFSTESGEGPDFEALPCGRYVHSMFYIQRLADAHGFRVAACRAADIRQERGEGVPGHLFILELAA